MPTIENLPQKGGHVPNLSSGEVILAYQVFFGKFGSANTQWREHVNGLGCAYERMKELAHEKPGSYFIFCPRTHRMLAHIDTSFPAPDRKRNCA